MILAIMHVVHLEDMDMFLERAWRIVNGEAEIQSLMKINVHACTFHFMRDILRLLERHHYQSMTSVLMWACSLLMTQNHWQC